MKATNKSLKFFSLISMLLALSALTTSEHSLQDTELRESRMRHYRLPNNTLPHLYHILLEPSMESKNFTWKGDVSIDIEVIDPTSILTLHAHYNLEINYDFTELFNYHGSSFMPINHYRNDATDLLKLEFKDTIYPGNYTLNIKFTGEEACCFRGFFRSNIGNNRTIASTFLEPNGARQVFPCWDEPGLKARFRVTILDFSNYTIFSNMPIVKNRRSFGNKVFSDFPLTPLMSTYQLNIVVSEFPTIFNDHKNVSLHTDLPLENVKYILDLSSKVIEVMESYTGVSFGFPAAGSVLVPLYPVISTEQGGLISYNQVAVNGNKSFFTSTKNESAYLLVAHQLSHAWFGNRVTALWWNDFWVNEALSVYFQYYIMDLIDENWGGVKLFVVSNNQETAFPLDTAGTIIGRSLPITTYEIIKQLQPLSHRKGAAIFHMFRNVLGDNVFRAGIHKYMTKNSFKSIVVDDFIEALQEAYNEGENNKTLLNLKQVMYPWLKNKGYPVITVTRNYTTGITTVFQRSNNDDTANNKWWIPLTFAIESNPNFTSYRSIDWINETEISREIGENHKDGWIIVNVQSSGYYRVNYDIENWNRLSKYLDDDSYQNIHVLNRAQIISDSFYFAQLEPETYYYNFHNIIKYLIREIDYLPWRAAHYAIKRIANSMPSSSEAYKLFQYHILNLMEDFVQRVGFEPNVYDDHYSKLARMDIISWACVNGNRLCADYATKKIKDYARDPIKNQLHPDTRSWVFCAGLKGLNNKDVKYFSSWAYSHAKDSLIENIGCTENHDVHEEILHFEIMRNRVRNPYETTKILKTLLSSSHENFNYAIDFFIKHYSSSNNPIPHDDLFDAIVVEVKTTEQLEKFVKVLQLDGILEDPEVPLRMINVARRNIAKNEASINRFLKCWDKLISMSDSLHDDFSIKFVPMPTD